MDGRDGGDRLLMWLNVCREEKRLQVPCQPHPDLGNCTGARGRGLPDDSVCAHARERNLNVSSKQIKV